MPTMYRRRDTLVREHDAPEVVKRQRIIDATAFLIDREPAPAQLAVVTPGAVVANRVAAALPARAPWCQTRAWLAAVIILGVLGIIIGAAIDPAAPTLTFAVATVMPGNLTHTVSAPGTLSGTVMPLRFATGGQIAAIAVQPGQQVQAGQIVAQLNPTALRDAVVAQQGQVAAAQASYQAALTALRDAGAGQKSADAVAQDAYDTALAATPAPSATQAQLARDRFKLAEIQAQDQVNAAQMQIAVAQAQVSLAQAQLTAAQHAQSATNLVAPSAGQVSAINGSVGATVSSADAVVTLANLATLRLTAFVAEADIGTVNVGWPVAFTVTAFPQATFYGTVMSISPFAQTDQQGVSYPVTIAIDATSATHARLFPGMTAQVTLTTQEAVGALLIPNTALTYAHLAAHMQRISPTALQSAMSAAQALLAALPTNAGGTAAYTLEYQRGALTPIPIVTGISDGTNTVVLAGIGAEQTLVVGEAPTTPAQGTK